MMKEFVEHARYGVVPVARGILWENQDYSFVLVDSPAFLVRFSYGAELELHHA